MQTINTYRTNREHNSDEKESDIGAFRNEERFGVHAEENDDGLEYTKKLRKQTLEEKSRLIEYYHNSFIYLKMKFIRGLLDIIARIVTFMLLINANNKTNFFSIYFCVVAISVWRTSKFEIKLLVKLTDFIFILSTTQYFLMVLNINKHTSPIDIPTSVLNPSVMEWLLGKNIILGNQYFRLIGFSTFSNLSLSKL